MVVIIPREGDLLNPLPFSIIAALFTQSQLYAANVIRCVIKAHQQDKYRRANCPNAGVNLKMARDPARKSYFISTAGVLSVQECALLQRTALC